MMQAASLERHSAAPAPGTLQQQPCEVESIRSHFVFPPAGRVVTNNAASTQPPRELLELIDNVAVQSDGRVVLGGFARNGTRTGYGLVRINPGCRSRAASNE